LAAAGNDFVAVWGMPDGSATNQESIFFRRAISTGSSTADSAVLTGAASPLNLSSRSPQGDRLKAAAMNTAPALADPDTLLPNDQGQIVVETAQGHALLLTPTTTPSALAPLAASVHTCASPNVASLLAAQMVNTGGLAFPSQAPTPGAIDGLNEPSPSTTASSSSTPSSTTPPLPVAAGMQAPRKATSVDVVDPFFAQLETTLPLNGPAKKQALSQRK
jgi:hypothetical protein